LYQKYCFFCNKNILFFTKNEFLKLKFRVREAI
jgi:hypothetical protein